ncbi:hypothetical protein EBR21_01855 [bacterium]|nr:hypothetical protein [bacterium]
MKKTARALESFSLVAVFAVSFVGCQKVGLKMAITSLNDGQQGVLPQREHLVHFADSVSQQTLSSPAFKFSGLNFSDPLFQKQWYLFNVGQSFPSTDEGLAGADIGLPDVLPVVNEMDRVVLALIDSGVDFQHPDLDSSRFFVNVGESGFDSQGHDKAHNGIDDDGNGYVDDVSGWSFAEDSPEQTDGLGHGTHLAGLLLAKPDNGMGIASPWSGFQVMSLQIFSGSHPSVPSEKIAQAIRYAVDNGASVISASFGTQSYSAAIFQALDYARQKDVLVVSAAGNFRRNIDTEPSYPASYRLANQITVAASDNRDIATGFTNYGNSIDIFAPGEAILSTAPNSQYVIRSGTSQACPLVAAVAAQLRALSPVSTSWQIKERILEGADEKLGLTVFSATSRRLSFKNALNAKVGARIEVPQGQRKEVNQLLESEHPYRSSINKSYEIVLPEGTRAFRLHFEQFSTQSTDMLVVHDKFGQPVQRFSGQLGTFWSGIFAGDKVSLEFNTDKFVTDWGWRIDKIEVTGM